jgi:phosphate uptake regulator
MQESGEALKRVWALKNRDEAAAREVLEKDDLIDDLEDRIDEHAWEFAARYQPLG